MQPGAQAIRPAAVQQQTVGGDEQDLEGDEEVEQIAGEEGHRDAEQLHLEQYVEMAPLAVSAVACMNHCKQREQRRDQHQQGRQPVSNQHDAPGRRPVAEPIDEDVALGDGHQQGQGDGDLCDDGDAGNPAPQRHREVAQGEQDECRGEGRENRQDREVSRVNGLARHRSPST